MPARRSFEYALVRVVPRIERGECLNAGVILWCKADGWLGARTALHLPRLVALAPEADAALIATHLDSLEAVARGGESAGPIGRLEPRERFAWLVAPRSTVIQVSEVHEGLCEDPQAALDRLFETLVAPHDPAAGGNA
jgi:hypothetical protein